MAAVDLDGDGAPDLVVSDYGTCDPLCYYNDGKGHFGEPRAVDLSPWWRPRWLSRG